MPLRGEFPEEGEHVVATVQSVRNFGAFVALDEYESREAFIHLSEVATGWVKYIRDYIREGQKIVARVIHVDRDSKQIDLSLKRINEHQRREKLQSWKNEQRADRLLTVVAQSLKIDLPQAYQQFGEGLVEKYGSLFKAFEVASLEPKKVAQDGFKGAWVQAFTKVARENISPPKVSVSGILEVAHPGSDGVVHVRQALAEAEAVSPETVEVQYVGAPKYRVVVSGTQYKQAEEILRKASDAALSTIKSSGGRGNFTHA
ncbi:MAG: translation initiation factor IF-2 subunit alpha [Euryarchaeota archaeon]|nr:translation initiation factor IF-2 subunit alpha [Euryarchaeota archaeon]